MNRLPLLALVLLVATAGFGVIELLRVAAPTMPGELRGFVAALLTFAAGALVIDRVTG